MSLDFLTRPIGGSKKTADPLAAESRPPWRRGPHPEDVRRTGALAIGGAPRVDLMPPEIRVKRSQLATRRSLRLCLVAVAAVVVLGCGATVAISTLSQVGLAAVQTESAGLLQQQSRYLDVKATIQSIELIKAGQRVAGSTEIDWNDYLGEAAALLPAGVTIDQVVLDQVTPVAAYQQILAPLQARRVSTLTITTTSGDIPPIAQILASMQTLTGVVDVAPSAVTQDESTRSYKATIVLHLDESTFDGRFRPTGSPAPSEGGNG